MIHFLGVSLFSTKSININQKFYKSLINIEILNFVGKVLGLNWSVMVIFKSFSS